ncbi:acyltransferase [Paracrocinitomix mangrovi]|uniref:acyltransferase family protein n=1 Tax=Paracrocinitomix mangrovi TaxID=2862509 RepID=UPI001C8E1AB0|nr:acyltransferase [Paracrocinitomix mangrovi]UKN01554.1 acyltransferase [Paracrocinitomix mangrovi]
MRLDHIKSLDGLRTIAIFLVLFWHYVVCQLSGDMFGGYARKINTFFSWTWSGVDLFFVLSGFLIGRILLFNKGSKNFFKAFYIRRLLRIFPAYYFIILLMLVYSTFGNTSDWLIGNLYPSYSYLLYIQNFYMAIEGFGSHWLSVTWSLAIEEQFYMILPFVVFLFKRKTTILIAIIGIFLSPVLREISEPLLGLKLGDYVLLPMRMDALLIGVVIAHFYLNGTIQNYFSKRKKILGVSIVALFLAYLTYVIKGNGGVIGDSIAHSMLTLFYGLFLIFVLISKGDATEKFLSNKIFSFVAKISYMIYLSHEIISGLLHHYLAGQTPQINNFFDVSITFLSLIITIVFSTITYYLFELRLTGLGKKFKY